MAPLLDCLRWKGQILKAFLTREHPRPETRNPEPETPNPKTETLNPGTRNPEPEIRSPKPQALIPKPQTRFCSACSTPPPTR